MSLKKILNIRTIKFLRDIIKKSYHSCWNKIQHYVSSVDRVLWRDELLFCDRHTDMFRARTVYVMYTEKSKQQQAIPCLRAWLCYASDGCWYSSGLCGLQRTQQVWRTQMWFIFISWVFIITGATSFYHYPLTELTPLLTYVDRLRFIG